MCTVPPRSPLVENLADRVSSIESSKLLAELALVCQRLSQSGFTSEEGMARLKPMGFNALWCHNVRNIPSFITCLVEALVGWGLLIVVNAFRHSTKTAQAPPVQGFRCTVHWVFHSPLEPRWIRLLSH